MSQAEIARLLKQKIGMDSATVSPSAIGSAIRQRIRVNNCEDETSYYKLLRTSSLELQEFIDVVTVPETWFLRDREPFEFLKQYVSKEWQVKHRNSVLRILSLPCSSGEEPYSIAITLLEAGLNIRSFQIDGVDVSQKVLQKAQRGLYTKNSFRMNPPEFQERYFIPQGDEYELQNWIRSTVRFSQDNILDHQFGLDQLLFYDLIFCRNLLIYFDRSDRDRALKRLYQMLRQDGILLVGHSEAGQIPASHFTSIPNERTYAFQKSALVKSQAPCSQEIKQSKREFKPEVRAIVPTNIPSLDTNLEPNLDGSKLLEAARKLADRGLFQEAISECASYLESHPMSVEAYLLLAQVYQAKGDEIEAVQLFQKVLYLDPKHNDALFHLCLLKEKTGDLAGAEIIRQRMEKLM
jgi:chemotaxis protein methyltransferase WspC